MPAVLNISSLENSTVAADWKRSVFIPIPKKGNAKEFELLHSCAYLTCYQVQFSSVQLLSRVQLFVSGRNINNLRDADDTTLMVESEEELQSLLTLTSIHDYWKNHSFDQTDIYWQNSVSAF